MEDFIARTEARNWIVTAASPVERSTSARAEELPTREIYVKDPGLIFKGNPKNYLTEIQLLLSAA